MLSSSPDRATNVALLHALRHQDYAGKVAVTAHVDSHAVQLTAAGADLVLRPFLYAADVACEALGLPVPDPEPAVVLIAASGAGHRGAEAQEVG